MTARKRKKGDFTVEKAVAIFTSATAAVGALMYALGKAYQDALLTGYGVAGAVRPSTFDVMLDAFNVWSEILTGLSAGALVFFGMLFGGNSFFGRAPTTAGLWLLAATAGTIGLFIALFLTTFQGSTDQFEASFKAKGFAREVRGIRPRLFLIARFPQTCGIASTTTRCPMFLLPKVHSNSG